MKKLTLALSMLVSLTAEAQKFIDSRSDAEQMEMRGAVKSIKTYSIKEITLLTQEEYQEFQRQGKEPPYYRKEWDRTIEFNTAGDITSSRCPESWTSENFDRTYTASGNLKSEIHYDDNGNIDNTYSFEYDTHGFITFAMRASGEKTYFKEYYTCNTDGKVVNMKHNYQDGRIQEVTIDYDGDLTDMKIKINGEMYLEQVFEGSMAHPIEARYWQNGVCTQLKMTYDAKGNPTNVWKVLNDGTMLITTDRTFDDYGNILTEVTFNDEGETIRTKIMTYTYDSHGNWVHREVKGSRAIDNKTEDREITYY